VLFELVKRFERSRLWPALTRILRPFDDGSSNTETVRMLVYWLPVIARENLPVVDFSPVIKPASRFVFDTVYPSSLIFLRLHA
jgi:hypothetical protein